MRGQWVLVRTFKVLLEDLRGLANDMIVEVEAVDGGKPLRLLRGPVRWDG